MQKSTRRSILVTGSNKGIGYATIEKLLAGNIPYEVTITSRSAKAGEEALNTLKKKYSNSPSTLIFHQLDINDDKSVDNYVNELKAKKGKLDILVNNAGISYTTSNDEQKELTVQTNFFNTVKLTEKLLPFLSDDGKVITITSVAGSQNLQSPTLVKALEASDLTEQKLLDIAKNISKFYNDYPHNPFASDTSYPASKVLLNTYIRRILVNKLKKTQQCYAVCPGFCDSDMAKTFLSEASEEVKKILVPRSVEEGADTPVYLINLPFEINPELNAKFISDRQVKSF